MQNPYFYQHTPNQAHTTVLQSPREVVTSSMTKYV